MKERPMFRRLAPHMQLILGVCGLAFLVASAWTIARAEIGTTLGLAATGLAFLIIEWSVSE